ncbi:unnamed protein product, partial [marine sediment metagenome]
MMRVPVSSVTHSPYLFRAGLVTEVLNLRPYNSATGVYFDSEMTRNLRLGMTAVSTIDTTLELGLHLQRRIWAYGNISFSLGFQDFVFSLSNGKLSTNPDLLSFIGVISSEQLIGSYKLRSFLGIGTGALAGATATVDTSTQLTLGVYAGFLLKTPIFAKWGGLDVIGEFDGRGLNLGLRLPIFSDYHLLLGFVHVNN